MLTQQRTKELILEAGFKEFTVNGKTVIVAADNGSSGNASNCAYKLVRLICNEFSQESKDDISNSAEA